MESVGRQIASKWLAWGLSALLLAVVAAVGIQALRHPRKGVPKVMIGTSDQVYYRGVRMEEATALGQALEGTGFFNDHGTSVMLSRSQGVPAISFVVNEGTWDHADSIASFEEIGRRVAPAIGGFPIQVHLVDGMWTIHRSLTVGRTAVGARDAIYYLGTATDSDARALGQALRAAEYLADLGVTVEISKDGGTAIGFVVGDGVWDRPEAVAGFEQLVRRVAAAVGGLPVELRLLNAQMEPRKTAVVR